MASPPMRLIHKNDIQWIIELWHRIHGGDPVPEKIGTLNDRQIQMAATQLIQQIAVHLDPAKAKAVNAAIGH